MKEDSETPFAFSPTINDDQNENEKQGGSSFFSKNQKLILIISGIVLIAVIVTIIIIIIIVSSKGGDKNKDNGAADKPETSTNYITAIYEVTKIKSATKIYSEYSLPPKVINYSQIISSIRLNDKILNIEKGEYTFNEKGNFTLKIYFKSDLNMLDNFFFSTPITTVDFSHFNVKPIQSMKSLFRGCIKLKTINYGDNFETSSLTNMTELFASCSSLKMVDLTEFDTSNVEKMDSLFVGCSELTNIHFGQINTKKVVTMREMFNGCKKLTSIDFSGFDTSKVTNFKMMFSKCESLVIFNSKFNTDSALDISGMFENCNGLVIANLENFNTEHVFDLSKMFSNCKNLVNVNLNNFKTENVQDMNNMFSGCEKISSIDLSSFSTPSLRNIKEMFTGCPKLSYLDVSKLNTSIVDDSSSIFFTISNQGTIKYNSKLLTSNIINSIPSEWTKSDISADKEEEYDEPETSTNYITATYEVTSTTSPVRIYSENSLFPTILNYTDKISSIRKDNKKLKMLGGMHTFNEKGNYTLKIYFKSQPNILDNFFFDTNITNVDFSYFNIKPIESMNSLFKACIILKTINYGSNFDTRALKNMAQLFLGCLSLTSIDVSRFDTSNVEVMDSLFNGCSELTNKYQFRKF